MEISALELGLLCNKISESVAGYHVSGIYSMEEGALLRLGHESKQEQLIAISSFGTWITNKNFSLPSADLFVSRIRDEIVRSRLLGVEQVAGERIARFDFENREKQKLSLYAEFFAGGNLILTLRSPERGEEKIVDVLNRQHFRHRNISPGEDYVLPPPRGLRMQEVSADSLLQLLRSQREGASSEDYQLTAIRWFGRSVGTSRKFVEEIFFRSKVNPESSLSALTEQDLILLAAATRELIKDVTEATGGYLLFPKQEMSINSDLKIDACPIITENWRKLERSGRFDIRSFSSFNEALDEAQAHAYLLERRARVSQETRAKISELDSAIEKQRVSIEKFGADAQKLREIGREMMASGSQSPLPGEITEAMVSMGILERSSPEERDSYDSGVLRFVNEPRAYLSSFNARSLASRLYDEAKNLEQRRDHLERVRSDLLRQRSELQSQSRVQEEREERKTAIERRNRQWFERYRWFITSDLRLAIGGRDSTTNSLIINKYTEEGDYVVHADLYGSPFFVLKKSQSSTTLSDEIALEMAQATVSFSRAWKDELSSADAYWVYPNQVKKAAPTGQYLPRGSFFIEGKKNYVKHVKTELAVGLIDSSKLTFGEERNLDRARSSEKENDQPVVLCGPERSLSKNALVYVKISFGKERASGIARRLKQLLVGKIRDEQTKNLAKKIPLDDFVRVLPSGSYKIVSDKQKC
jgi:predicted ribosome quality control (RQC) complex YloA/Tae2 family protein